MMQAIITGDIINSRKGTTEGWMEPLKAALSRLGKVSEHWAIFRGDSFQAEVSPDQALLTAFHIKASIKQDPSRDVRMAIGMGDVSYRAGIISESNGQAFIYSGSCYEKLGKNNLAIMTDNSGFNTYTNIVLKLMLLTANAWTPVSAETVRVRLENQSKSQKEISAILGKSESSVSEILKRAGYDELLEMNQIYLAKLREL